MNNSISKRIGCVILNYNDSETTIKLLSHISGFDSLDEIIVVDNKSTDDSSDETAALAF